MSEKRPSSLLVYDIYQSIEKIEEFIRGISVLTGTCSGSVFMTNYLFLKNRSRA